jgi:hypothetical protein
VWVPSSMYFPVSHDVHWDAPWTPWTPTQVGQPAHAAHRPESTSPNIPGPQSVTQLTTSLAVRAPVTFTNFPFSQLVHSLAVGPLQLAQSVAQALQLKDV